MLPDYCINTYQLEIIRHISNRFLLISNFEERLYHLTSLKKNFEEKKKKKIVVSYFSSNINLISPAIFTQHLIFTTLTIFSQSRIFLFVFVSREENISNCNLHS